MDTTVLQSKIDTLNQEISSDQSALSIAQAELAQASIINSLEGLDAEAVTAINEALASDVDNKTGISLSLPPATE